MTTFRLAASRFALHGSRVSGFLFCVHDCSGLLMGPLSLLRASLAKVAPTVPVVTPSANSLALTPMACLRSFPCLGVWFSGSSVKTTNASKKGKENMNAIQKHAKTSRSTNRIIKATGEVVIAPPPANGSDYTTEELSRFIGGGVIEILEIDRKTFMVLDDNFRAKALPFNVAATWIYAPVAVRRGNFSTYPILGNVAIIAQHLIK
jgi:hypothetical protein